MILKPKNTHLNPHAILYKRYTQVESSITRPVYYKTRLLNGKYAYWYFSFEKGDFIRYEGEPEQAKEVVTLAYRDYYFNFANDKWNKELFGGTDDNLQYPRIQTYQRNKYYYSGSFEYIIRGDTDSENGQFLKGNITAIKAMTIKFFDDNVDVCTGDLVVIENHLYIVESVSCDMKFQPKRYRVYFAILNGVA